MLANISPLLSAYAILFLVWVLSKAFKVYSVIQLYISLNLHYNMVIGLFVFMFQEEFMIVVLQLANCNFANGFNISSFVIAVLLAVHLILLFRVYFIHSLDRKQVVREQDDKYILFQCLFHHQTNSAISKLYHLPIFIAQALLVVCIVFDWSIAAVAASAFGLVLLIADEFVQNKILKRNRIFVKIPYKIMNVVLGIFVAGFVVLIF